MYNTGRKPEVIIEEKGYKAQDDGELEELVKSVLDENPEAVEDIKNWKMKAIGFLVGQIMKKSAWRANPAKAKDIIMKIVG